MVVLRRLNVYNVFLPRLSIIRSHVCTITWHEGLFDEVHLNLVWKQGFIDEAEESVDVLNVPSYYLLSFKEVLREELFWGIEYLRAEELNEDVQHFPGRGILLMLERGKVNFREGCVKYREVEIISKGHVRLTWGVIRPFEREGEV